MSKSKSFTTQLIIIGGFLFFLYIFFALATSVYKDYRLDASIGKFEDEIDRLDEEVQQKPKGVAYYQSSQYKDRYAKENLNLLNPGEQLIIIPQEEKIVKSEVVMAESVDYSAVLKLPNRNQWWEYFFGHTLSLKAPSQNPTDKTLVPTPAGEEQQG